MFLPSFNSTEQLPQTTIHTPICRQMTIDEHNARVSKSNISVLKLQMTIDEHHARVSESNFSVLKLQMTIDEHHARVSESIICVLKLALYPEKRAQHL